MPDQNNTEGQQEPSSKKPDVVIPQEPNAKTEGHGSKEINKKWHTILTKGVLDDAWGKVIAESILATVAVTVAYIYWSQLQAMSGQLQEMQDSSTQTNLLIVNAAHQASETHALAVSADKQAKQALALTQATKSLADQARISAGAASHTADTAARELELSQRPWVDGNISFFDSLTFNVNGANIPLEFTLRNTGHSPAFATNIQTQPTLTFIDPDPTTYRKDACQTATRVANGPLGGVSLFPDAPFVQRVTTVLSNEKINEQFRWYVTHQANFGKSVEGISMVICIGYSPAFISKSVYSTSYVIDIFRLDDKGNLITGFPFGQTVEVNKLRLRLHPWGGIEAN